MVKPDLMIEIVYALPDVQYVMSLGVPQGTTIYGAIGMTDLMKECPEIDWTRYAVGVYGVRKSLQDWVADGDRVEIYRPLIHNPMDARRARVSPVLRRKRRQSRVMCVVRGEGDGEVVE
jgi:putative ubiquitin-RnfH superfamily antitoxin RatB of RatAB toxin-antitoxin module